MKIYFAGNAGGSGKKNSTEKFLREAGGGCNRLWSYDWISFNGFGTRDRWEEYLELKKRQMKNEQ